LKKVVTGMRVSRFCTYLYGKGETLSSGYDINNKYT
jgi:hypothetical protein